MIPTVWKWTTSRPLHEMQIRMTIYFRKGLFIRFFGAQVQKFIGGTDDGIFRNKSRRLLCPFLFSHRHFQVSWQIRTELPRRVWSFRGVACEEDPILQCWLHNNEKNNFNWMSLHVTCPQLERILFKIWDIPVKRSKSRIDPLYSINTMILSLKYLHRLCWTKLTAILVGTNSDGPSFFLSRSCKSFCFASSVASIFLILALIKKIKFWHLNKYFFPWF